MKKIFLALFTTLLFIGNVNAQDNVGIGILNPHPSSILDLTSNNKGLLVPRMDSLQRNAIATPANGLLVFDNNYNCFYFYKNNSWQSLCETRFDSITVSIANFDTVFANYAQFDTLVVSVATFDSIFSQVGSIDTIFSNIVYTDSLVVGGQPLQTIINNTATNIVNSTAWLQTGNAGTNPTNNFVGTIDNQALSVRTNGLERLRVEAGGNIVVSSLATGMVKSTAGVLQNAIPGTDYQTPLTPGVDYQTPLVPGVNYQTPITAGTGLSFSGSTLNSVWSVSGNNIFNNNIGSVTIGGSTAPVQTLHVQGRIFVNNGVIQRGGTAITATNDLGLYSRVSGEWMRYVTNNARHVFFTQEGASGIGQGEAVSIETGKSPRMNVDGAINAWGIMPIGSIVAWTNHLAGTPGLPVGWLECNGQTISDAESPLNGQTLPNLNGTFTTGASTTSSAGRFLRGTTGATGTLEADQSNSFAQVQMVNSGTPNSLGPVSVPDNGNWSGWVTDYYLTTSDDAIRFRNHGRETRPGAMTVRWIMRIK